MAFLGHGFVRWLLDLRNDFTVEGRHRLAAALKYDLDVPALLIMDEPQ